jgi:hypothetical protein
VTRVATLSKRTGMALVTAALPATVVTFAVGAFGRSVSPVGWIGTALAHPVATPGGVAWAFHVAVMAGLIGVWLTGAGLVVEGFLNVD